MARLKKYHLGSYSWDGKESTALTASKKKWGKLAGAIHHDPKHPCPLCIIYSGNSSKRCPLTRQKCRGWGKCCKEWNAVRSAVMTMVEKLNKAERYEMGIEGR